MHEYSVTDEWSRAVIMLTQTVSFSYEGRVPFRAVEDARARELARWDGAT